MATAQIDGVVQNLRALVRSTADGRSDGELLDCYLVRREAVAARQKSDIISEFLYEELLPGRR